MSACIPKEGMHRYLRQPTEGTGVPGAGVMDSCQVFRSGAGNQTLLLLPSRLSSHKLCTLNEWSLRYVDHISKRLWGEGQKSFLSTRVNYTVIMTISCEHETSNYLHLLLPFSSSPAFLFTPCPPCCASLFFCLLLKEVRISGGFVWQGQAPALYPSALLGLFPI